MICGVHGSPAKRLTRPIWSKCKPVGIALACAAGFFTCAQPTIPARAAPAINNVNKNFLITNESELLAKASENFTVRAPRHESDAAGDEQMGQATLIRSR